MATNRNANPTTTNNTPSPRTSRFSPLVSIFTAPLHWKRKNNTTAPPATPASPPPTVQQPPAPSSSTSSFNKKKAPVDPPIVVKLVLVGDSGSGKSCFLTKFVQGEFIAETQPTAGAFVATRTIQLDDERLIEFNIWDTAGDDRYRSLAPTFIKGANVAFVVYDVTRTESFERAKIWVDELKRRMSVGMIIALVGNKIDLVDARQVSENEAKQYVKSAQLVGGYFEASAKTSDNVDVIFKTIAALLPRRLT
jgi:Ras-related protein Rab-5C